MIGEYTGGNGENANTSAADAIETARSEWVRMYRAERAAGREVPVVTVPREMAPDSFRASADATDELSRLGSRSTFTVSIDLAALEAKRRARLSTQSAHVAPSSEHRRKPAAQQRRRRRSATK